MANTIMTVDGEELTVHPISYREIVAVRRRVEQGFRDRGEPIEPPTYTADTELGPQTYTHDETTVETDEEKEAWRAHKSALDRLSLERSNAVSELAILKGLRVRNVPDDWIEEQATFGVPVPDDPRERLLAYAESRFLPTPVDVARLVNAVIALALTGSISEDEVKTAEETFRRSMGSARRRASAVAGRPESGDGAGQQGRSLDVQPLDGGGEDGEGEGLVAEPVAADAAD